MLDQRNSLCKGPEAGGNGLLRNSKPQVSVAQIPDQGESGEVEWAKPFRPCSSGHEVAWADSHLGFFFFGWALSWLWRTGSQIVAHGLYLPVACGILLS